MEERRRGFLLNYLDSDVPNDIHRVMLMVELGDRCSQGFTRVQIKTMDISINERRSKHSEIPCVVA